MDPKWPTNGSQTCFEWIRDVAHHDFWIDSLPFTCTYAVVVILSTALETWVGHFLPLEVTARLAVKWPNSSPRLLRLVLTVSAALG